MIYVKRETTNMELIDAASLEVAADRKSVKQLHETHIQLCIFEALTS